MPTHGHHLGISSDFTILDQSDSEEIISDAEFGVQRYLFDAMLEKLKRK